MANGTAARLPLELLPSKDPSIETQVGEAAAAAVEALGIALNEYWRNGHSASTRTLGGERIARLYELQQSAPAELDFPATVRAAGKRVLFQRYSAPWRAKYGSDMPDGAFDVFVDGVLEVVAKVTAFERAMAH